MISQRNQGGAHVASSVRRMAESTPEADTTCLGTRPLTENGVRLANEADAKRRHIPLKTKLASALAQMLRADENGKLVPIIPYEHRKLMTADQIISLFQFNHNQLHAFGGPDEHWNLDPLTILEHRRHTKDVARPASDKVKRLRGETCAEQGKKIPQRANPWPPKGSRKIQSRGFAQHR